MVLDWALGDSFYWRLVDEITRNTTDPKRLAYVRLALKDIHEAIAFEWSRNPQYKLIVYIVVDITEE
jgi:hypothetical protein